MYRSTVFHIVPRKSNFIRSFVTLFEVFYVKFVPIQKKMLKTYVGT